MYPIPFPPEDPHVPRDIAWNIDSIGETGHFLNGQVPRVHLIPGHPQEPTLFELGRDVHLTPVLSPLGPQEPQSKSLTAPVLLSLSPLQQEILLLDREGLQILHRVTIRIQQEAHPRLPPSQIQITDFLFGLEM